MIGSLVKFLYADDSDNICIVVRTYDKNDMVLLDGEPEEEVLYLVYDLKNKEYFYALTNELNFIKQ